MVFYFPYVLMERILFVLRSQAHLSALPAGAFSIGQKQQALGLSLSKAFKQLERLAHLGTRGN
jgi:hypothetical protein